jgi:hypothetical protein
MQAQIKPFYVYIYYTATGEPTITQFLKVWCEFEEQAIEEFRSTFYFHADVAWEFYAQGLELLSEDQVRELGYEGLDKLEIVRRPALV